MTPHKMKQRWFDPTKVKSEIPFGELIGKTIEYASTGDDKNDEHFMFIRFTDGACLLSYNLNNVLNLAKKK